MTVPTWSILLVAMHAGGFSSTNVGAFPSRADCLRIEHVIGGRVLGQWLRQFDAVERSVTRCRRTDDLGRRDV